MTVNIRKTPGTVGYSTRVVEIADVRIVDRPTLNVDISEAYRVQVVTTVSGTDSYSIHADGKRNIIGRPKPTVARNLLNAVKAIVSIARGQATYTLDANQRGISPQIATEASDAISDYNTAMGTQEYLAGKGSKNYVLPVSSERETIVSTDAARTGLERFLD